MALQFNGSVPTAITFNGREVTKVIFNSATVWEAISISAPTNLMVNGATSDTAATCALSWTAAVLKGATGTIRYYIYKDGIQVGTTESTTLTLDISTISSWSGASLTVAAYNDAAGLSDESNAVIFTYKAATLDLVMNASKYCPSGYSSISIAGKETSEIGRSTTSTIRGMAVQFLAPDGGWEQYTKAELYVYRMGGSASANVEVGKMTVAYSTYLGGTEFYYNNLMSVLGSVDAAGGTGWFTYDISSALPTGTEELGITLVSKNAYIAINGLTIYIHLS